MATRFLVITVFILGILAGFSSLGAEKDSLTIEHVGQILQQQAQSANSARARLEIQMRLLSPEEQRQVDELGELEHQLASAQRQLETGKAAGTMDFLGGFIEAARLDYRQWKRELARIEGIKEPGPAWQLRQMGELINSRQFSRDWPAGGLELSRAMRRMVIEQVNARLLVSIKILRGVRRPDQQPGLILPTPR